MSGSVTISYTTLAEIFVACALIGGVSYVFSTSSSSSSLPNSPHSAQSSTATKNKKKKRSPVGGGVQGAVEQVKENVEHVATTSSKLVQEKVNQVNQNPQVKEVIKQVGVVVGNAQEKVGQVGQGVIDQVDQVKTTSQKKKQKGSKTPPTSTKQQEKKKEDDMRDYEIEPENESKRVMKIVGGDIGAPNPPPSTSTTSEEWEKVPQDDDEGEWDTVVSKKPSRPATPSLNNPSSTKAPIVGMPQPAAVGVQTKKQRENALKKAKEDALKREQQEEQERRLKLHRDQLARARAQEEKSRKMAKPTSQNFFGSDQATSANGGKGNLHAGLDPSSGSLVWD
ncbi:hypothetical protein JCM5353_001514 [Sporobolomyces roseus]